MIRMTGTLIAALAGAVAVAVSAPVPALAHHSHAMFDMGQEVTVAGTVSAIRFANPHVFLLLEVADDNGGPSLWTVEMSTVSNMIRRGIAANTFKVGDEVTVTMNPLRNGQSGGNYTRIESINGVQNTADGSSWSP
jgi:hypothetical protein